MKRLLFCTEKHIDCNPARSLTNSFHNLFGSLKSTGLAEFEAIHYDEYAHQNNGSSIDDYLLQRCESTKPDAVFFSYFPSAHWGVMQPGTINRIREMGIKTIFIWWDFGFRIHHSYGDLMIDLTERHTEDNYLYTWTPQDPLIYNDPGKERTIDVSFWGTIYIDRPFYLNTLGAKLGTKYKLAIGGGQRNGCLAVEQYADLHQRSKIVLNFCNSGVGSIVKGRVFESLFCGALLMEQFNYKTQEFFEPGKEYVEFYNPDDMCDKIEYYLAHEEERAQIAKAGHERVVKDYNATAWWEMVLNRVFPPPAALT